MHRNSQVTYTYKKLTRLEFDRTVFKAPKDSLLLLIALKRKKDTYLFSQNAFL